MNLHVGTLMYVFVTSHCCNHCNDLLLLGHVMCENSSTTSLWAPQQHHQPLGTFMDHNKKQSFVLPKYFISKYLSNNIYTWLYKISDNFM